MTRDQRVLLGEGPGLGQRGRGQLLGRHGTHGRVGAAGADGRGGAHTRRRDGQEPGGVVEHPSRGAVAERQLVVVAAAPVSGRWARTSVQSE